MNWLKNNIKTSEEFENYFIPFKIYFDFDIYDDAMRCLKIILRMAEEEGDQMWRFAAFNNIGMIYKVQGNYDEMLKMYEEALLFSDQLGDLSGKTNLLNNIASIHFARRNYDEALKMYEEAFLLANQLRISLHQHYEVTYINRCKYYE